MMSLLHSNVRDARLVVRFQLYASLSHGSQLMLEHSLELSFAHTIPIKDDPVGLEPRRLVELDEQLLHHRREFLDHLLLFGKNS